VNVVGTALLGFVITRLQGRRPQSIYLPSLLGTGFCGAFTTFSTFQIEVIKLVRHGHAALAIGYLTASLGAGLVVVYLGTALARRARLG
jgi:fluoride exporter